MEATVTATAAKPVPISPNTKLEEIVRIFNLQQKNKQAAKNATASERKAKIKKLIDAIFEFRPRIEEALHKDLRKAAVETILRYIPCSQRPASPSAT
jgi:hypothetical protein